MELPRILWDKSYIYIFFYTHQTTISKIQQNRSSGQRSIDFVSTYSSSTVLNALSIIQQHEGHQCPRRDTISSTSELGGALIAREQGRHSPKKQGCLIKHVHQLKKNSQPYPTTDEDQVFEKIHSKSGLVSVSNVFPELVNRLLPQA